MLPAGWPVAAIEEFDGAEQVWPLRSRRSPGAIPGRRLSRDLARHLCALRRHRRTDSARRIEVLERRPAGSLCLSRRGAEAAFSRSLEAAGLDPSNGPLHPWPDI